ncbi:hypothetical protein L596_011713 [Steinernema carpocapsae]|uniref:Saccharopine dehydrogenase NADP binding domain-containing protein n=1 Tax=Steinernema carpocapsae TaxID=34508 RepID=A0A4U5NV63_STECR|nr:hypothetical protein L596_011713 [Steinernema carpocapsae]
MNERFDLVFYGITGFTGTYVFKQLLSKQRKGQIREDLTLAVAGRNDEKLKKVLDDVSKELDVNLALTKIIIADSSDPESLAAMARQAKVIVNTVGPVSFGPIKSHLMNVFPFQKFGEAVIKAAVENGASHVDISGEAHWIEEMEATYSKKAAENGVYVVGACGWDSIPCDLGVNFLKKNFGGDLNYVETFVQINTGPAGYALNEGTYQTAILDVAHPNLEELNTNRQKIMPQKLPNTLYKVPSHKFPWGIPTIEGYALPFLGADKSIVNRSQYYDYAAYGERPVQIETYFRLPSLCKTILAVPAAATFLGMAKFGCTRKILQNYPDQMTMGMFKRNGPSREQMEQTSFTYWILGTGWNEKLPLEQEHGEAPTVKKTARCDGPDPGYMATSGCLLSAALTILDDKSSLPPQGGVYTSAAAFGKTKIYDRLANFGVTFRMVD